MEIVDSVHDLKSSSSVRGIQMPNFEVLGARIASALNRIIHNSHFKRRISLEEQKAQKEDRFLRGRQIAHLIYDYFRNTGANDSVENYADLFTISLRNDDIQEFDSKWDGILLSMTKIPPDDILEGLYTLRIRESEKFKTVLELYDLEIHQKKIGPDYHRLKTMVKRSIEQDLRNRSFGARNGYYERNAVVKNQGTKTAWTKNSWQIVGNGSSTGSVLEETIAVSVTISISVGKMTQSNTSPNSFMQQNERNASRTRSHRGKSPSGRMSRWPCKDYFKGTCINSFCEKVAPSRMLVLQDQEWLQIWGKSARMHIVRLMNNLVTGPKKNDDKSAVAMLKKYDLHDRTCQPVVNRDKGHDRTVQLVVKRDTRHELNHGPVGCRSSKKTTI